MGFAIPIAGAAVVVAGVDKVAGLRGYRDMFRHLGWSREAVQAAAIAETLGGALMIAPATRQLGGATVAVVSALLLASELRHRDPKLAAARGLVLLAGLAALLAPVPRRA